MPEFRLPDLGEGLTEAEIISWRVQVGDTVTIDQIVIEVETAKAAVEVPIPFAGEVTMLHGAPGESVAVGAPLITVAAADESPAVATAEQSERSGNVLIGYGTPAGRPRRHRVRRTGTSRSITATPAALPAPIPPPSPATHNAPAVGVISPLVRKQARDAGLDLAAITGSGPAGLILRRDVDQARAGVQSSALPPTALPLTALPPTALPPTAAPTTGERRIPLTGMRKLIADKLTRSRREIPEATVWVDVDATELLAARAVLNAREPERPISVLALVARFAIIGLHRYPELNGRIEGDEIVVPSGVNLGFAAQTDRGLVVPVVRAADQLSARELSGAISTLTASARNGQLSPSDLTQGTFTVNNYGVFGVDGSAAIINHPEVAILGLGRIIDKPWVVDGALAVRKVTQLTLAFDHRVCDGGTAGGFLRFVADCVEAPITALG